MKTFMIGILLGVMCLTALAPIPAQAVSRDVRAVLVAGSYGIVGGTVLGAIGLPFTQDLRTLFIGSSLGLYLGLVVGFYYVLDRDSPLRLKAGERHGDGDPRFTERELRRVASVRQPHLMETRAAGDQLTRVDVPVFRF